jgi:integrase
MNENQKELADFTNQSSQQSQETTTSENKRNNGPGSSWNDQHSTGEGTESSSVCDCYQKMKEKYKERIAELGITPPKCGHCIAYLCNKKAGTAEEYATRLRMFVDRLHQQDICIKDVEYVDVRDFFEFRQKQGRSKSTISNDRTAIKGVISRFEAENKEIPSVSWKIIQNIDAKDYSNGSGFEREPLNYEEIHKLLSSSHNIRNKLMVLVDLETGPRNEATCLIKLSDVNLENKTINLRNTKYGRTYIMPLTDDLNALLEYWINTERQSYIRAENNEYLFPSKNGGRITSPSYRDIIYEMAERAGIQEKVAEIPITETQKKVMNFDKDYRIKWKVDVHVLRHTCSRLMKNDGVSKSAREYALDHSKDVTDGYGEKEDMEFVEEIREDFDGVDISAL